MDAHGVRNEEGHGDSEHEVSKEPARTAKQRLSQIVEAAGTPAAAGSHSPSLTLRRSYGDACPS